MNVPIQRGLVLSGVVVLASLAATAPAFGGAIVAGGFPPIIASQIGGGYGRIQPASGETKTMFQMEDGFAVRVVYESGFDVLSIPHPVSWLGVTALPCPTAPCDQVLVTPLIPVPPPMPSLFTIFSPTGSPVAEYFLSDPAVLFADAERVTVTTGAAIASGGFLPDMAFVYDLRGLTQFELTLARVMYADPFEGGIGDIGASAAGAPPIGTFTWPVPEGEMVTASWRLFRPAGPPGGVVPEPASLTLAAAGVLTLAWVGWSRRRARG